MAKGGKVGNALALQRLYNGAAPITLYAGPNNLVRDGYLNIRPSSNYIIAV